MIGLKEKRARGMRQGIGQAPQRDGGSGLRPEELRRRSRPQVAAWTWRLAWADMAIQTLMLLLIDLCAAKRFFYYARLRAPSRDFIHGDGGGGGNIQAFHSVRDRQAGVKVAGIAHEAA